MWKSVAIGALVSIASIALILWAATRALRWMYGAPERFRFAAVAVLLLILIFRFWSRYRRRKKSVHTGRSAHVPRP